MEHSDEAIEESARSFAHHRLALLEVGAADRARCDCDLRAAAQGRVLKLSLGYSHDIEFPVPEGVTVTTPKPTEIIISGIDPPRVGQVAAEVRAYRPPEPYKGKGVRYADERVVIKETKKK